MNALEAGGRPILVGNWKMNGRNKDTKEAMETLLDGLRNFDQSILVAICPPATLIRSLSERVDPRIILVGAQDCVAEACGARTGDINAELLSEAGAQIVILGHSERRTNHCETDQAIRMKIEAAWGSGLTALVCIGESLEERENDQIAEVIYQQLDGSLPTNLHNEKLMIAYEPVWAIGTGLVPSHKALCVVYDDIRAYLQTRFKTGSTIPILYGGSVSASNTGALMTSTPFDGLLVGKASLNPEEFLSIAKACAEFRH